MVTTKAAVGKMRRGIILGDEEGPVSVGMNVGAIIVYENA